LKVVETKSRIRIPAGLAAGAVTAVVLLFLWLWTKPSNPAASGVSAKGDGFPDKISFNFHIRPILSDKCFACHGPDAGQRQAGLRLDIRESAFAELPENPGNYAIVPGDADASQIVMRVHSESPELLMPPPESNLSLSPKEKLLIEKWIEQGAEYTPHWAFIPPLKAHLPVVQNRDWPTNEIDHFILHRLEGERIAPAPEAHREQLIRRLCLDLTGLPPTPEAYDRFSQAPGYESIVDTLLSSPEYAEHMAADWLDLARYADSHGYQDDSYRSMWPWRDWVIAAFRRNMPYDQFLTWQLAGDLLPDATVEQILATGFNRNHPITQEGGVIQEEYRTAYVSDRTDTFGKGLLGITLECAKCHDHKYDPISMQDYYGLFAFFNNVKEKGLQMDAVQAARREYFADAPFISISRSDVEDMLHFVNLQSDDTVNVMVMNDSARRTTYVLDRGVYDAPADSVSPSTPPSILNFPDTLPANRYGLAIWLTNPSNPLTARVFVNRIWHKLFGQGIVKTVEDFGNQGSLPSHPELLDWLAVDFMENGWDIRQLIKKIVMSSTYRQSSDIRPELIEKDPENTLLARGGRYRLSAEMIRDYYLATSGLLHRQVGGPSVKPYQPAGLWAETNAGGNRGILTKYVRDSSESLYRRSLYTFWKRTLPHPTMTLFDAPNRDLCEVRRQKTNTPLQALALQNDIQVVEASRVLAQRLMDDKSDTEGKIEKAFRSVLIRSPEKEEMDVLRNYYASQLQVFEEKPENAAALIENGEFPVRASMPKETASLMMVAMMLYNLDETINRE
jgi:hypothetical protein